MGLKERSANRRRRIEAHRAKTFQEAEDWDLAFWQKQGAEARLSALVALRRDVIKAQMAGKKEEGESE